MEEIFGCTILDVMAEAEREGHSFHHTWRMLGGVLVFMVLSSLLNLTKLVKHLQIKVQILSFTDFSTFTGIFWKFFDFFKLLNLPYRKARDHLMWFLLQCLSAVGKFSHVSESCGYFFENTIFNCFRLRKLAKYWIYIEFCITETKNFLCPNLIRHAFL